VGSTSPLWSVVGGFFRHSVLTAFSFASASWSLIFSWRAPSLCMFGVACSLVFAACWCRRSFSGFGSCLSIGDIFSDLHLGTDGGMLALLCFCFSLCVGGGSWSRSSRPSSYACRMSLCTSKVVAQAILPLDLPMRPFA